MLGWGLINKFVAQMLRFIRRGAYARELIRGFTVTIDNVLFLAGVPFHAFALCEWSRMLNGSPLSPHLLCI